MDQKVIIVQPGSLTTQDLRVTAVAGRFHMNSQRLLDKINALIPNPAEQQVYLAVAEEFGLRPRRFVHILRRTLNHREIRLSDFREVETGPNTTFSYGPTLLREVRLAIHMSSPTAQAEVGYQLTSATAGEVVALYGEEAESFFVSLGDYVTSQVGGGENRKSRQVLAESVCRRVISAYYDSEEFVGLLTTNVEEMLAYLDEVQASSFKNWGMGEFDRTDEEE